MRRTSDLTDTATTLLAAGVRLTRRLSGPPGRPSLAVSRRHAKVMMESCKALQ